MSVGGPAPHSGAGLSLRVAPQQAFTNGRRSAPLGLGPRAACSIGHSGPAPQLRDRAVADSARRNPRRAGGLAGGPALRRDLPRPPLEHHRHRIKLPDEVG